MPVEQGSFQGKGIMPEARWGAGGDGIHPSLWEAGNPELSEFRRIPQVHLPFEDTAGAALCRL